jgi:hypothetical protein
MIAMRGVLGRGRGRVRGVGVEGEVVVVVGEVNVRRDRSGVEAVVMAQAELVVGVVAVGTIPHVHKPK